jgi:prefoldin subunit 4
MEDLDDAQAELMLADDDEHARLLVGDSFWKTPKEEAEEKLETLTDTAKEKQGSLEEQIADIKEQMGQLKVVLYAKFGKSINLEE